MRSRPAMTFSITCMTAVHAASAQCEPVWTSLDGHRGRGPQALAAHDEDGSGPGLPALFVAGGLDDITTIARWDGWESSAVSGPHDTFYGLSAMLSVPETVGMIEPGLYVGGDISVAGGLPVDSIARWDGEQWHEVGGGLTASHFVLVEAMTLFDEDGAGPLPPALFVGGRFQFAGGVPVTAIARWDGERWSEVGGSIGHAGPTYPKVRAMTVYDDGRGPALYVGGNFDFAGGKGCSNIARWDGAEWEPVGPGLSATVESMCVFDEDGPGPKRPALFAGGQFSATAGGSHGELMRIGRWDGERWSQVGGWDTTGAILTMATWDADGPGPERESLYIGGFFRTLPDGTECNQIAQWDGQQWHTVGGGIQAISGIGPEVTSLAVFDEDGHGPNPGGLYVGGAFSHAGGVRANHIARWGCPLPATPCYADCDGDGELAFFDFLCFQNQFAAGATLADCDYSGDLDFFDFLCFQNAFAAGCP